MRNVIKVEEAKSGDDDDLLWIGLYFKSDLSDDDRLFIVCGKQMDEQDKATKTDGLYFERLDQLYSGYNAATLIIVAPEGLDLDLTAEGSKDLKLPSEVRFDCVDIKQNWEDSRKVLRKMADYEWGSPIKEA